MMITSALLGWLNAGYRFRFVGDGNHTDMYITVNGHIPKSTLDHIAKHSKGVLDWVGVDANGDTEVKFKIPSVIEDVHKRT